MTGHCRSRCSMAFNPDGKIQRLTITAVDLYPLTEAIRSAAETGALQSS